MKTIVLITAMLFSTMALSKDAVLITAFGTSEKSALVSYETIEKEMKKAFPKREILWAYTSYIIRNKLKKTENKIILSPVDALNKLIKEGYNDVIVQPLHVIPGIEYNEVKLEVASFSNKFEKLTFGEPLISSYATAHKLAKSIVKNTKMNKNEKLVLMGHGTHHGTTLYYIAMNDIFKPINKNVIIGTVEGHPSFDDVMSKLSKKDKVVLRPLMIVAGDHAKNDMASKEDDESWYSMLKKKGIQSRSVLQGLGEIKEVATMFATSAKKAPSIKLK